MALKLYFVLALIQLSSGFTLEPLIPLKCLPSSDKIFDIGNGSILPSLKLENLPRIPNIKIDTINLSKDGFVFETTNIEYLGLDKAIFDDFGLNLINNEVNVTFHTDVLVRCPYKVNGTLFSKPIYGEGFIEVFIKNIQFGLTMPFGIVDSKGNKFIELKNFNYWYDTKGYAQYKLDNLYNGDKEKSDAMHRLMNENWKYMMENFGYFYMSKIADTVFDIFKKYLLDLPLLNGIDKC